MDKLKGLANEGERLNALKGYYILDTLREDEFDRFTQLIAIICETPISLISLLDEKRQWFKSKVGLDVEETSRDVAFCQYTIADTVMMQVVDATRDSRFMNNVLVTGEPKIKFYAGYPLIDPNGCALGSLCVIDRKPKKLTEPQEKALQLLAGEVTALIVQRKEKEHLLNFQRLFNQSNDLVCIASFDGYFKSVNPAFSKMLGYPEAYFVNNPFLEMIHPDDMQATSKEVNLLRAGESSVSFINRYKTSSGAYKVIEWTGSPDRDQPFFYAIGRDITLQEEQGNELRRTKEMLEQTNKVARVGGWEFKPGPGTIYWSSVTREIHEVPDGFIPDLSSGINFYKPEHQEIISKVLSHSLETGDSWDLVLQIQTAKGKDVWVRSIGHAEMKKGKCVRLYGTFQDIDDQKNEAITLEKSAALIRQQNDRLQNFAHIVSHNLRSHSGNLAMILNMINEEADPGAKLELIEHLDIVSNTLNETIDNLTEIVKVQADVSQSKKPIKLQTSFNAAVNTLSTIIRNEKATVTGDFDALEKVDHIPAYVDSIMLNFISNSLKYKHPGRDPIIKVASSVVDGKKHLTFLDNGIGIDLLKHGKNLFGMYKTFHKHPDARGVGLYITKSQVESTGGTIDVESKPGEGTTFTITF